MKDSAERSEAGRDSESLRLSTSAVRHRSPIIEVLEEEYKSPPHEAGSAYYGIGSITGGAASEASGYEEKQPHSTDRSEASCEESKEVVVNASNNHDGTTNQFLHVMVHPSPSPRPISVLSKVWSIIKKITSFRPIAVLLGIFFVWLIGQTTGLKIKDLINWTINL